MEQPPTPVYGISPNKPHDKPYTPAQARKRINAVRWQAAKLEDGIQAVERIRTAIYRQSGADIWIVIETEAPDEAFIMAIVGASTHGYILAQHIADAHNRYIE